MSDNVGDGNKARNIRGTDGDAFKIDMNEFPIFPEHTFFNDKAFTLIYPAAANGADIVMPSSWPIHEMTRMPRGKQGENGN